MRDARALTMAQKGFLKAMLPDHVLRYARSERIWKILGLQNGQIDYPPPGACVRVCREKGYLVPTDDPRYGACFTLSPAAKKLVCPLFDRLVVAEYPDRVSALRLLAVRGAVLIRRRQSTYSIRQADRTETPIGAKNACGLIQGRVVVDAKHYRPKQYELSSIGRELLAYVDSLPPQVPECSSPPTTA